MELNLHAGLLRTLNSLTKYPSIPTFHTLGEKGRLQPEAPALTGEALLTEKIDGTNARMIFCPDGRYLLGSRENLLWADGDLIGDPAQGIVEALKETAGRVNQRRQHEFFVLYGELYGGKITGASKQYTGAGAVAFRLFDMLVFSDEHVEMLRQASPEALAGWREAGGQPFVPVAALDDAAARFSLERVPELARRPAAEVPTALEVTFEFLKAQLPASRAALDEGAGKQPEGIVIRHPEREWIFKLRFEDYERTLRRR